MRVKTRSKTSRASFADSNFIPGATLQERRSSLDEVLVEHLLDRVLDALRELEDERAVVGVGGTVCREVDGLPELDPPLRRKRHHTERAKEGERRGDREVRRAGDAREHRRLGDLGVGLLAAAPRARQNRRAGPQRDLDEAAAAEALQPVAVL